MYDGRSQRRPRAPKRRSVSGDRRGSLGKRRGLPNIGDSRSLAGDRRGSPGPRRGSPGINFRRFVFCIDFRELVQCSLPFVDFHLFSKCSSLGRAVREFAANCSRSARPKSYPPLQNGGRSVAPPTFFGSLRRRDFTDAPSRDGSQSRKLLGIRRRSKPLHALRALLPQFLALLPQILDCSLVLNAGIFEGSDSTPELATQSPRSSAPASAPAELQCPQRLNGPGGVADVTKRFVPAPPSASRNLSRDL
jgi:hypothetical protein